MFASGFAGLAYQIVWTRQCGLWLGHEAPAVLGVVSAFFGGLALGAWWLGARAARSLRPLRWYAGCELLIAAWAVVLALTMHDGGALVQRLIGLQPSPLQAWALIFAATLLALLPATAAMGATLPVLQRATQRMADDGVSLSTLYAANTFGAVAGALGSALWLVPQLGLSRTALLCAALNVLCALCALQLPASASLPKPEAPPSPLRRRLLISLFVSGLVGIGYEVLVVRVLSEVTEDTVYTFALLLAVYLLGSAGGAALHARLPRLRKPDATPLLLRLAVIAGLAAMPALWNAAALHRAIAAALGDGMAAALAAEALLALCVFLPPTLAMGLLFPQLATQASLNGIGLGTALGINTLGAALAPMLIGVLAYPQLGAGLTLLLLLLGYVLLQPVSQWWRSATALPVAAVLVFAAIAPPLRFVDVPDGGTVLSYRTGAMAAVSVVEDAQGVRVLRIDNRQQEGSNVTQRVDGRQALLPMLLHPAPRRALFLGLGTGVTASTAAEDPRVEVHAVELLPDVIAAAHWFRDETQPAPPLHMVAADARRYVRVATQTYDLIVADNFHPARSGSGALYTVEHFDAVRTRLADGGLFCQWLPLHQLDAATLRSIVRSYLAVFPDAAAMLASNSLQTPVLGLVWRKGGTRFAATAARHRLVDAAPLAPGDRYELQDEYALLGSFVAGPASLAAFAADAPLNTDDRPVVSYLAPTATYAPTRSPAQQLVALMQGFDVAADEVIIDEDDARARLQAYRRARLRYLEVGLNVQLSRDPARMLAQLAEPLLAVLRISPDFRPAYDPLLQMADSLAQRDAETALQLLKALQQVQPARSEAAELSARILDR